MSDYHNAPTRREMALSPHPKITESSHKGRRLSIIDKFSETEEYMRTKFQVLQALWNKIEMSEDSRLQRTKTAFDHIHNLIDDMVESEQQMVQEVQADIKSGLEKIKQLRDELDMDEFTYAHNNPSLALLRSVEKELRFIQNEHDERKKKQNEIVERISVLAQRVGRDVNDIVPEKKLLSSIELETLRTEAVKLQSIVEERVGAVSRLQEDLRNWIQRLDHVFDLEVYPDLKAVIVTDVDSDDFMLDDSMIEHIESFHKQIYEIYQSWLQDQDFQWTSKYTALEDLWNKCMVAPAERGFLPVFDPLVHTEKDILRMGKECARLESVYALRKRVYDYLQEFNEVWEQKLSLDSKKRESGYYQSRDRSHNILKDAQLERHLENNICRLEKIIAKTYSEYISKNPDDQFRIHSRSPPDFIKYTKEEYAVTLEEERQKRALKKQASSSTVSSPRTPQKKAFPRTPMSTGKLEPPTKKIMLDKAFTPRSGRMPSLIPPINKNFAERGPKTSSPIQTSTPARTPLKRQN